MRLAVREGEGKVVPEMDLSSPRVSRPKQPAAVGCLKAGLRCAAPCRRERTPPEVRAQRERERELRELDRDTRTVFAYNLNLRAEERDLFALFASAGGVGAQGPARAHALLAACCWGRAAGGERRSRQARLLPAAVPQPAPSRLQGSGRS